MTSTTQEEIYKTFAAISGQQASNLEEITNSLTGVVAQINKVQPQQAVQTATAQSSAPASTGGGVLDTVESVATTVLKSGLGMVPLVGELLGLFGGGDSAAPTPLVKYAMPAKAQFEAADTQSGLSNVDYDQSGMARAYSAAPAAASSTASGAAASNSGTSASSSGSGGGGGSAAQITVNVQAMDARSFLDRSSDIAAAVRDAMLNLSSINDVVNDL